MKKSAVTLTQQFNETTVKKGETFQLSLLEGGRSGVKWDIESVAGGATLLSAPAADRPLDCSGPMAEWSFQASGSGDIEIKAITNTSQKCTFKVHVK